MSSVTEYFSQSTSDEQPLIRKVTDHRQAVLRIVFLLFAGFMLLAAVSLRAPATEQRELEIMGQLQPVQQIHLPQLEEVTRHA